jgi:hypothetical protein
MDHPSKIAIQTISTPGINIKFNGVAALIDRIGFVGIDLGSLGIGGRLAQFPGGPLPNQNLVRVG